MAENIGYTHKDTVSKGMEVWLYKYKQRSVKEASFNRLLISFSLLRKYRIANVRIMDLCTADIQSFIDTLLVDGYAMSTLRKANNLLSAFVKFSIGEGIQVRPAHLNVVLPRAEKVHKQPREVIAYDREEQERLRAAIYSADTIGAHAALLMLETGMRVGEVLALRWSDIIWARRAVRIHSTMVNLQSRKRCHVQESAKSRSSMRTIPLSTAALEMLSKHRKYDDSLVFVAEDGKTSFGYNSLRNQLQDLCQDAKVEYFGAHAFRHTFATNAFYKGCEIKILSKLLGHASVTITYNTYIHLYGDALEEMRSIVG